MISLFDHRRAVGRADEDRQPIMSGHVTSASWHDVTRGTAETAHRDFPTLYAGVEPLGGSLKYARLEQRCALTSPADHHPPEMWPGDRA